MKETIKPSSPTPSHLKTHNLTLLDQFSPHKYLPLLLFYPSKGYNSPRININEKSRRLKTSLSQTLNNYYPFAGRLSNGVSIDCNDKGVDFYEAHINCKLSKILEKPDPETLDPFYPQGVPFSDSYNASLVVLQVTFFECGGMAVATCFSHKIADGATACSFISDWAAVTACQSAEKVVFPKFISGIVSQPNEPPLGTEFQLQMGNSVTTRRYVFSSSKIMELKAMVVDSGVPKPTRVEVVSTFIFKLVMSARRANSGSSRPSLLVQLVNLRPGLSPPLPKNSAGNFSWVSSIMAKDESEKDLGALVGAMKKGMAQFSDKYLKNLSPTECYYSICDVLKEVKMVMNNNDSMDIFTCSSLCGYPFREMNFGWGAPIWVGYSSIKNNNTILLLDAKEGGVEAWITLEEKDMAALECDEELLAFASLNVMKNSLHSRL
ncbi:acyltransferase Pun1-like [Cornus florida]|uniref:acyltransferase Pun1-like n=1 Tax=Cornus florida TaxID=4283 RepID=UPI00289C10DC|nr:acyltransferase Pun1-like [Cornus florida]